MLEFFAGVPNLKGLAPDLLPPVQDRSGSDALKLESIHSFCGHVTLEGAKTRLQGAVLGDVAPGTLFDFWTAGQPRRLLFLCFPNVVSYSETQFNLPAFYESLKRACRAALPQGSSKARP